MPTQEMTAQSNDRSDVPRRSRLVSLGILLGCAVLLHGIVFTSLDAYVPIDDGSSSDTALFIDSGMKPMDMLVDAR